jgi:hypothetical protein
LWFTIRVSLHFQSPLVLIERSVLSPFKDSLDFQLWQTGALDISVDAFLMCRFSIPHVLQLGKASAASVAVMRFFAGTGRRRDLLASHLKHSEIFIGIAFKDVTVGAVLKVLGTALVHARYRCVRRQHVLGDRIDHMAPTSFSIVRAAVRAVLVTAARVAVAVRVTHATAADAHARHQKVTSDHYGDPDPVLR